MTQGSVLWAKGRISAAVAMLLLMLAAIASPASADQGDVDAAARGVVRVVIVSEAGGELVPVTHGTGFAVSPTRIVTNAHVVQEALQDDTLRIGMVPSEGSESVFVKPVAISPRNDLALLQIVDSGLRLPPLTVAGGLSGNMGEVSAVGYPMNVDLAQGLEISDIFDPQPPVKARGFLSGERPSRQFDTILHTAPIARGNSGGPLLDGCGRVLGVNSFGADSDGSDAEFYFAVSLRELLPFLRENGVDPRVNAMPCRSIDELNAEERARFDAQRAEAQALIAKRDAELRDARGQEQMKAQMAVLEERDDAMALALVLLLGGIGIGVAAHRMREGWRSDPEGNAKLQARAGIAAGVAGVMAIGAVLTWVSRPGYDEIESRVAAALSGFDEEGAPAPEQGTQAGEGSLICTLVPERSRVTSARTDDVQFDWRPDGCVNGRTQYGMTNGEWTRVLVPSDTAAVSVNTFDPRSRTFRTDRYLLSNSAMQKARAARGNYKAPACGVSDASRLLGERQSAVLAALPDRPNERLVYSCSPKPPSQ